MKNTILLIILLLARSVSYGQSITEAGLIGKWKVVRLIESKSDLPADNEAMVPSIRTAFSKSTFEFKSDKHFDFNIDFPLIGKKIKNVHWKFNVKNSKVTVQEWVDRNTNNYILIDIIISVKNGQTLFELLESPFTLQVEKY